MINWESVKMSLLIPVQYHKRRYPEGINPYIQEIAGHFDVKGLYVEKEYSLHTEYSYGKRKFDTDLIREFYVLRTEHKRGVPQLWKDKEWSIEFADFIFKLTESKRQPKIIEIHPPFNDYYNDVNGFIESYKYFEDIIKNKYLNTTILIENRCGSIYSGGKFLVMDKDDIINLSNRMDKADIDLKITLDIPQLFTAHHISKHKIDEMIRILKSIKNIRHNIHGLHLWGKRKSENGRRVAHIGDLNSYFIHNQEIKNSFLENLLDVFNDQIKRYFVPEVNSNDTDLDSIVNDLLSVGFEFVEE